MCGVFLGQRVVSSSAKCQSILLPPGGRPPSSAFRSQATPKVSQIPHIVSGQGPSGTHPNGQARGRLTTSTTRSLSSQPFPAAATPTPDGQLAPQWPLRFGGFATKTSGACVANPSQLLHGVAMQSCCPWSLGTWSELGECPGGGNACPEPFFASHWEGGRGGSQDGPQSRYQMEAPSLQPPLTYYSTSAGLDLPHL